MLKICLNKITVVELFIRLGDFPKKWKNQPKKLIPFEEKIGHENVIIIDPKSKTIKLYEPYGSSGKYYEPIRQFLIKYAKKHEQLKTIKFEVLPGDIVCPSSGPQAKSDDSLCGNWSLLFLYTHVQCPHADLYQIQELLAGLTKDRLEVIMQGWACFLWNYIEEEHIKDVVDWLKIKEYVVIKYDHIKILRIDGKFNEAYEEIKKIENSIKPKEMKELVKFVTHGLNGPEYRRVIEIYKRGFFRSAYIHMDTYTPEISRFEEEGNKKVESRTKSRSRIRIRKDRTKSRTKSRSRTNKKV